MCVFFPFILDIKFVGRTRRGHTGGRPNRISHPPPFCGYNGGFLPGIILLTQCYYYRGTVSEGLDAFRFFLINPFERHEDFFLYLQPILISPKRFDMYPPDWGMLRRSRCVQIFLLNTMNSFCPYRQCSHLNILTSFPLRVDAQKVSMRPVKLFYCMVCVGDIGRRF